MHHLLEIWFGWVLNGGYLGIIVLMAMESSIFPVPSEIVIPPAAFLAARGDLNFTGVILAGTFGSYLGAAITYWVSRAVGRPVIQRFGKFFFVTSRQTGACRSLAGALRSGRRVLCASLAGHSPSDFDSGRDCSDEFLDVQRCHDRRLGALVRRSGLSGRQSVSRSTGSHLESGRAGAADQGAIPLDRALCRGLGDSVFAGAAPHGQTNPQARSRPASDRRGCSSSIHLCHSPFR